MMDERRGTGDLLSSSNYLLTQQIIIQMRDHPRCHAASSPACPPSAPEYQEKTVSASFIRSPMGSRRGQRASAPLKSIPSRLAGHDRRTSAKVSRPMA